MVLIIVTALSRLFLSEADFVNDRVMVENVMTMSTG